MKVRLLSGSLESTGVSASDGLSIMKPAMLVYEGKFESMDGEVEVTAAHIDKLVETHNKELVQLTGGNSEPHHKDCPPIQLDHSVSAKDTVGRLVGPLTIGEYKGKKAIFGNLKILGAENVEKVNDGRWTHLSIGADFETGKLNELTITPFPAAPNASMLSQFGKGEAMDKEKMKKHLMEKEKLSAEDADKKMSALSKEDGDKLWAEVDGEEKKKLAAAEEEEKKKLSEADPKVEEKKEQADEKKEDKKNLSAAKEAFIKLSRGFKTSSAKANEDTKKIQLSARLTGLRMKARITPAEIKKIDLVKMSKMSDEAIEAVFETYENRQPVVMLGQFGDATANPVMDVVDKLENKKMIKEMGESMRFSKGILKKLGAMPTSMDNTMQLSDPTSMDGEPAQMSGGDMHGHFAHLQRLMSEGKHEEAMAHCSKCMAHFAKSEMPTEQGASQLSGLAENYKKLQNQFEELVKLAGPALGVTADDLKEGE